MFCRQNQINSHNEKKVAQRVPILDTKRLDNNLLFELNKFDFPHSIQKMIIITFHDIIEFSFRMPKQNNNFRSQSVEAFSGFGFWHMVIIHHRFIAFALIDF